MNASLKFISILLIAALFPSCASHFNRREFEAVKEIKIAHYQTPNVTVITAAAEIIRIIGGTTVVLVPVHGFIAKSVATSIDRNISEETMKGNVPIPDFGELFAKRISERATIEVPGWPRSSILPQAIDDAYRFEQGYLLTITIRDFALTNFKGLMIRLHVTIKNLDNRTIFSKWMEYNAREMLHETRTIDDYPPNNWKMLIEELPLAADFFAGQLIASLNQQ